MTRTTISLHETTLDRVKVLSRREHRSLGETITELLHLGLKCKDSLARDKTSKFALKTSSMRQPRIPLEDKEAIHHLLNDEG